MPIAIDQANTLAHDDFVRVFGPVYEHSPWIAADAWSLRPFASLDALHDALQQIVLTAPGEKQLALINAHPDLVGRAALAGSLTSASTQEQASAGLDRLSPEEIAAFQTNNAAYREKFGFPFIICARLNKKAAILAGFTERLKHSRDQEIATALAEIGKIARFRLADLVTE